MKKAFIIIVSLFLVFTSFSCVNKKTPTKEEPKQVEKTPEQEPTTPVTPDEKEPVDPSIVNPDEKEPVEPVKPKVKHKITYVVPDYVKVDGLPTEYVEGEGLESIGEPIIHNENLDEDEKDYFVYWYIDDEETTGIDFSEVVMSVSKDETRDLVLTPRMVYSPIYKQFIAKWAIDINDKIIYPFASRNCFSSFPAFTYYGRVTIDKNTTPKKIIKDDNVYYKLYCDVKHIYGNDFLEFDDEHNSFFGNITYINKEINTPYFIYMAENKYEIYSSCDEFIIRLSNYRDSLSIDDKTNIACRRTRTFPSADTPLSVLEKDGTNLEYENTIDIYPIIDGIIYIQDQSQFINSETSPFIYDTYRYYINNNITDNPTVEEFDIWMKECRRRIYERTRYNSNFGWV